MNMVRTTTDQGIMYLTADLRPHEARFAQMAAKSAHLGHGSPFQRFPPIEDVLASLDRIASRGIAA
jgi:hypothetical protein